MNARRLTCLALALAVTACRRDPEPIVPAAPKPAASRVPCRCRGVEAGDALLDEAQVALARGIPKAPDLPPGWMHAGEPGLPAADDPLWLAAQAAPGRLCAMVQEMDTPLARVRVLVVALERGTISEEAARPVNAALPPGAAPAIVAERTITLIAPGDRAVAAAWSRAASSGGDTRELKALRDAAESDDAAAFDAAFAAATGARPADAMPWAYKAGVLARRGEHAAAKLAAAGALARAERDAEARAEALHWQQHAERATGAGAEILVPLADREVNAALEAAHEPMRARALYDRAVARALGRDDTGAREDLRAALDLERGLGGRRWRDAAKSEDAFARLRATEGDVPFE